MVNHAFAGNDIRKRGKYANLIDIMNPSKMSDDKGYRESKEHEVSNEGNKKY